MERLNKIWKRIKKELNVIRKLYRDSRTPWVVKALAWTAIFYAAWWFDPIVGPIDDIIVVGGCVWLAYRLTPKWLLEEIRSNVI